MSNNIKTEENFDLWNDWKQGIEEGHPKGSSRGDIWIYREGVNIGRELSKGAPKFSRPCLVINNDVGKDLILIIPISSKMDDLNIDKKDYFIEVLEHKSYQLDEKSFFVMNQIKVISSKRLLFRLTGKRKDLGIKVPKYDKTDMKELLRFIKNRVIEYNDNYELK